MNWKWDKKYIQIGVIAFSVIAASMLFYFAIFHMPTLLTGLKTIYTILAPIVYALVISYILWPIIRFTENKVIYPFCKRRNWQPGDKVRKLIRMACVVLALCLEILLIYGLLSMLIPELISSITNITDSFPRYISNIQSGISNLLKNNPEMEEVSSEVFSTIMVRIEGWLSDDLLPNISEVMMNFSTGFLSVLVFFKNFLIGSMISIYLMYGKEKYIANAKRFFYCLFSLETANNIQRDFRFVDRTFGGFIVGKIVDSMIIGVLCYIGTLVLNFPYALLISVIVGVTNVIPFFGPYIGAIPSALLIFMVNPIQCLYFIIFILVLQQFDGNFLGPKILGGSTGLSGFMVIVAIIIGGGLFGVVGMFVGVPVCAIICTVVTDHISMKLKKKRLPDDLDSYIGIDHIDMETRKPVFMKSFNEEDQKVFRNYGNKKRSHFMDFLKASEEQDKMENFDEEATDGQTESDKKSEIDRK